MNQKTVILAVSGLCLLALGGIWLVLDRKNSAPPAAEAGTSAPNNAAHERAMLEQQLAKKPGHAPILLRLAQLSIAQNQFEDARRKLEQLLRSEPGHVEARLELGRVCYELNDMACATKETESILATNPDNPDALYNLGAIHANAGRMDQARQYWKKAVQSAASSDSGKKARAGLQKIGG